ncbi:unnamed protein product [Urochloa humidicola]
MLANKSSSPPGQNAVTEIAIDIPLTVRVYKNCQTEQAPRSPFVPASEDPGTTGVATRDAVIDDRDTGVAARLFLPIAAVATGRRVPLVVFFHGSGGGSSLAAGAAAEPESSFFRTYHRYATALAARAGALVVSVEHRRLSPERAGGDAWAALRWAAASSATDPWILYHADRRRTFLAGDGAGGDVACRAAARAAARLATGEDVHVEGMLLVDPYFGEREWWMDSEKAGGHGGLLSPAENAPLPCRRALVAVVAGKGAAAVGGRGRRFAASMRGGGCLWGGEVTVVELHGVDHGFHLYGAGAASGGAERLLMESIVEFVNKKDCGCGEEVAANLLSSGSGPCKAASGEIARRAVTRSCL